MEDPSQGALWLTATTDTFRQNKETADRAIAQLSEAQLRVTLDPETNSVAVVMKHVAGNLRSRWTDFLTTDGEKPDRDRDREFIDDYPDRKAMIADWESGWRVLFQELASLQPEDAAKKVEIRGCPLSVPHAAMRSATHCAYHVGHIVQTARIVAGKGWQTLTIPRGESGAYNEKRWGQG